MEEKPPESCSLSLRRTGHPLHAKNRAPPKKKPSSAKSHLRTGALKPSGGGRGRRRRSRGSRVGSALLNVKLTEFTGQFTIHRIHRDRSFNSFSRDRPPPPALHPIPRPEPAPVPRFGTQWVAAEEPVGLVSISDSGPWLSRRVITMNFCMGFGELA